MEYIVKVHYKTAPEDTIWTYSGKRHANIEGAKREASEAEKKPHIDMAFITATDYGYMEGPEIRSDMDKAILKCIDSVDNLFQILGNEEDGIPLSISLGAVFCTVLDDCIRDKKMTVEEAVVTLQGAIQALRKYGGKIDDEI